MNRHLTKTDNASVANKVFLRREATSSLDKLRVLDLYAGKNVLWSFFDCERYYGVEIVKDKGKNLQADCKRVVGSLDLSQFNVIDCDSYGVPFDVMLELFRNSTLQKGTVVIYTAISNKLSGISKTCLEMFGLQDVHDKSASLARGKALELFYAMLEKQGVDNVRYYSVKTSYDKHYGYFVV